MLKLFFKKQLKKLYFKNLIYLYTKYSKSTYFINVLEMYNSTLQICLPKRQHFTVFNYKSFNKIQSTGLVLAKSNISLKYYKRSYRSNTGHILHLQNLYTDFIKYLYLYFVKNFNYRQWVFFQKFLVLTNSNILLLLNNKSYNTYYRPVKRLKRRVLKLLNSNS